MNRPFLSGVCLAALLATMACQTDKPSKTAATGAGSDVDRAVAVTLGIKANPAAADSILTAHSLTPVQFDSLMWVIALDSAKAAAYRDAID